MIRRHAILILGVVLTAVAGVLHTVLGDTAGTIAASLPLLLVAPLVAQGTDALRGRLSNSVVGIVQSGFGNIAGSLVSSERSRGLASQNGTVGVQIRSHVSAFSHVMPAPGVLLMHSEGITSRWSCEQYPGLLLRHPTVIAGVLSRDFLRGRDDATVLVVSRWRKADAHG